MNITYQKHIDLLIDLGNAEVDFILGGGWAVIYHGYLRTTGDMDIWLKPDNLNKQKLVNVFTKRGNHPDDIKKLEKMDFTGIISFHMGNPPERIDFMTRIDGVR